MRAGRLANAELACRHEVSLRVSHGIVPALDVESLAQACRLVETTTRIEGVVAYKVGLTTVLRHGLARTVRALRQSTDLPLIYDHQKAGPDIPDMARKLAALAARAGVDGLILFPIAGPSAVEAFVGEAYANRLLPIIGGELPLADYTVSGGGFIADDALARIVGIGLGLGADHFVVPATDLGKLRRIAARLRRRLEVPFLFLPGIGALGGTIGAAFAAAKGCRAYAVVGRAVYGEPDPGEAARRLAAEALRFA